MGQRQKGAKMESNQSSTPAIKSTGALTQASDLAAWGKRDLSTTSIVIPRILKMEFMSEQVKEQKAKFGDFTDSLTGEVIGNIEQGLQVIPVEVQEKWAIYTVDKKGAREFKEIVPITPQNESWKYKDGQTERDRIMDVYVLLVSDFDSLPPDWKERGLKPLPKIFGFRRTSIRAGKKLYTQMYVINQSKGLPPPAVIIQILGKKTDGEKGTYITLDAKPGRHTTKDEMEVAFHWYKAIRSGETKVDETEITQNEEAPVDLDQGTDF